MEITNFFQSLRPGTGQLHSSHENLDEFVEKIVLAANKY